MKKQFRPEYFLVPDIVMTLPPSDRFIFATIYYFERMKDGICKASNNEIARIAMVEVKTVQNSLDRLEKEGFIQRFYKDRSRRIRERIVVKVSLQKDTGIPRKGYDVSLQKGQISNNIINNNDNKRNASISGEKVSELIYLFKEINPNYDILYQRKNQRDAITRLVDKHGFEKIESAIKALPKIIVKKYAPTITTPIQLENRLGELVAFYKKEQSSNKVHIIT